jgi:hypothetical protein
MIISFTLFTIHPLTMNIYYIRDRKVNYCSAHQMLRTLSLIFLLKLFPFRVVTYLRLICVKPCCRFATAFYQINYNTLNLDWKALQLH